MSFLIVGRGVYVFFYFGIFRRVVVNIEFKIELYYRIDYLFYKDILV